jgi:hypothetical protein
MLAVCIWVMAGTAMWHFGALVPDRFYRGIIGALVAANAGALAAGLTVSAFTLPDTTDLGDAFAGLIGGLAGLALSWLAGSRYDPIIRERSEQHLG